LNQSYKERIFTATEVKDVNAITLTYKTEEEKSAESNTEEEVTESDAEV